MISTDQYNISISFRQQPLDGLHLRLVDGNLKVVFEGHAESLALRLHKGLYQLKASLIDYCQDYFLEITSEKPIHLDFNYPATAPVMNFVTTHEYYSDPAREWSINPTSGTRSPNFFFFAAPYDRTFFKDSEKDTQQMMATITDTMANFTVFNDTGDVNITFTGENTKGESEDGVTVFSTHLKTGLYFLKYKHPTVTRLFPFYILEGYQTQYLVRYTQEPDFANCIFFYNTRSSFERLAPEYMLLDKIQYAFKDIRNLDQLTAADLEAIKSFPYLIALMIILDKATVSTRKERAVDFSVFNGVPFLPLPDIEILDAIAGRVTYRDNGIPVINGIMGKLLGADNTVISFAPGSLIDRISDHINYDVFWNNSRTIDQIAEIKELYDTLVDKSTFYSIADQENIFMKTGKRLFNTVRTTPENVKQERLETLLGTDAEQPDMTKFSNAVNSISNATLMAAKFNVPVTTVLRNYTMFDNLSKRIK
jgi:hypothetical protein